MSELDERFERFKAARAAGERPRVRDALDGLEDPDRTLLGELIAKHLEAVPSPPRTLADLRADPGAQRAMAALEPVLREHETWPVLLPAARHAAEVNRSTLVQRLADALGAGERAEKVGDYYHRMEVGTLPAAGVSTRVLEALSALVAVPVQRLRDAGARTVAPPGGGVVFARSPEPLAGTAAPVAAHKGPDAERDAVDALFTGG